MAKAGVAGYIIGVVLALYVTAYTLPEAIAALVNGTTWSGVPTPIVTLGTTVLAIIVILGIAIEFMPEEIKSKMGLWATPYKPNLNLRFKLQYMKYHIAQLSHFER